MARPDTAPSSTAASSISPPASRGISDPARGHRRRRLDKTGGGSRAPSARHALDAITWLPPIPAPEKIICIGVNYPDRNEEYKDGQEAPKYPSMFIRFPRSFVGHDAPLMRPRASEQLDYEGEIVIVIGKAGRRIPESTALEHIAGVRSATKAPSATGCATPSST